MARDIIYIDHGWENFKQIFNDLKQTSILTGIQSDEDQDVLNKALWNEYGTVRIPERSFLRAGFKDAEKQIRQQVIAGLSRALSQGTNVDTELNRIALFIEGKIKRFAILLDDPPNAPITVKKKGSDNPLIDTGEMTGAIRGVVDKP